jgi:hypothetical protein
MNFKKALPIIGIGIGIFVIGNVLFKPPFELWWQNGLTLSLSMVIILGSLFYILIPKWNLTKSNKE